MDLSLIYREEIMDHIKNPKNFGSLDSPSVSTVVLNKSCGDKIVVFIKEDKGIIRDIKYTSSGCAISTASASILSEKLKGMPISVLEKINEQDILENFYNSLTPGRQKCALLIYEALKKISKHHVELKNKKI